MHCDPIPVPVALAGCLAGTQEPKTRPDQPSPTQGGGPPPAGPGGTTQQPPAGRGIDQLCGGQPFLLIGLFLVVMWLMVLRPEQKRRKETQQMLSALKQGDKVVTIGGMHGIVTSIAERTVTVRVEDVKMVFDRSAIARVERDEPKDAAAKKP